MGVDTYKKNVVSVQDTIFDKDIVCNGKSIAYSDDDIKKLDKAIVYIKIPKSEAKKIKDIQFVKDAKIDKPIPLVTRQTDHKDENLDENLKEPEQQAKDKDDQWA